MPRVEPKIESAPDEVVAFSLLPSGNLQVETGRGETMQIARRDQVPFGLEGFVTTDEATALLVPDRCGPLPVGVRFLRRVVGDPGARHVIYAAEQ